MPVRAVVGFLFVSDPIAAGPMKRSSQCPRLCPVNALNAAPNAPANSPS